MTHAKRAAEWAAKILAANSYHNFALNNFPDFTDNSSVWKKVQSVAWHAIQVDKPPKKKVRKKGKNK